ncbi:MFS transporter [Novosphingobium sp. M1R2S20]|uniref:MFS transporter n=1 Tax=Novosphingobium rhizovicinum TaxID=3228928 RepID=A0ABV3RE79_9SPHN
MTYLTEFRLNWRSVLATFIGISTGSALSHYTMSLFAPELIKEFGWSKAQFALVGSLPFVTMLLTPFMGRFADRVGARIAAIVGFVSMSLGFFGLSAMTGNIYEFFAIWLVQHIFGVLSTSLVFSRIIVERFDKARGTALSLLMMGPPITGAVAAPLLGMLITDYGWRSALVALGIVSALGGVTFTVMLGRRSRSGKAGAEPKPVPPKLSREELSTLVKNRTFLLLVGGMFLINVPQVFAASQIKLIVLANGVPDTLATWMVSLYAVGVIMGRLLFGLALDRVSAHILALFGLSLPAIGYVILAAPISLVWLLAFAVLIIGIAQGAEGDLASYMISRHFDLKNYSLILGFVKAGLDGGGALGAVILSYTLAVSDSYSPFLLLVAVTTLLGAFSFFMTGPDRSRSKPVIPLATEAV